MPKKIQYVHGLADSASRSEVSTASSAHQKRSPRRRLNLDGSTSCGVYRSQMHQATRPPRHVDAPVHLRAFRSTDRATVIRMLVPVLTKFYPGGDLWLTRRLDQVNEGKASCIVATKDSDIVGVVILTPKSGGKLKVSTLYVDPLSRGYGIGVALLERTLEQMARTGFRQAYITVPHAISSSVEPTLKACGFAWVAQVQDRYGPDRNEIIYEASLT